MGGNGLEMLTELFNGKWEEERIPKDWDVGIVIPLFQKGDIGNCREITLLNVVLKVFERIVEKSVREISDKQLVRRITEWLQKRKKLSRSRIYIKTNLGQNTRP